jgi:hypothetical protein
VWIRWTTPVSRKKFHLLQRASQGKRGRLRLKCDGTRAETRFLLSAKRTSPFKSAWASVQSTTGSRGVRISGSNAGYTMFRGVWRVLATHSICQFPLHFPPVRHCVPSHFNWTLKSVIVSNGFYPRSLNRWLINMNDHFMLHKYMYMQLYTIMWRPKPTKCSL